MAAPSPASYPPAATMMQIINGKCLSRCVSVAAELAIADMLADGPKDVAALAKGSKTSPDGLYRILRTLAAAGVFVELPERRFQNNPLSATLISNWQGSVRHYARWFGAERHWHMWSGLEYSVRTGRPWFEKDSPGKTPFEALAENPADQEIFNCAMAELSSMDGPAIVQAYDFSRFGRIIDVGGGHGHLGALIAASAPDAKVTVFDQSHVTESAKERSLGRVEFRAGNFFESVSGPVDLCVLKHVLHDWDDEAARRILANCRNALSEGGRVLVCKMVIGQGPESMPALVLDLEMLVGPGGRERTQAEYSDLFAAAGLRLERMFGTRGPIQLLEGVRMT